jgi:ferredoxin, 2Fe-2S
MPKITFMPSGRTFDVPSGTTILHAAVRNGVALRHDCTEAVCGTDRVKILTGQENLSEVVDNEELTLEMLNAASDERLGCVAKIHGDVVVEIS